MDASTINSTTITLRRTSSGPVLSAVVTYDSVGRIAALGPEGIDAPGSFTVTVASVVADTAGNVLGTNYEFTFLTGDGTRPSVTNQVPGKGAIAVATGTMVAATFSEPMDSRFVNPTVGGFSLELNGSQVEGVVTYDSATRTTMYTPKVPLQERTTYTARIAPWLSDLSGMQLGEEVRWTFTTVDNTPPTAIVVLPPRGNTDIQPNAVVVVAFSEPMDVATINASTIILRNLTSGVNVAGTITLDSALTSATLKPSSPLTPGNSYRVAVTTGARDLAGNALRSEAESNFFTAPNPDVTSPVVLSTTPSDTQTGVATSAVIRVGFSENVTGVSATTFLVRSTATGTQLTGTVTYNGSFSEGTFTPSPPLSPNTSYTVTLTTGISDYAGNALVQKTFTFTTGP